MVASFAGSVIQKRGLTGVPYFLRNLTLSNFLDTHTVSILFDKRRPRD
jgi:hypothetical protein